MTENKTSAVNARAVLINVKVQSPAKRSLGRDASLTITAPKQALHIYISTWRWDVGSEAMLEDGVHTAEIDRWKRTTGLLPAAVRVCSRQST